MNLTAAAIMLQQLLFQAPMLLVYLVGFVLAMVYLKKARVPAILTMLATGALLLVAVATAAAQSYLIGSQMAAGGSAAQIGRWMAIMGISASVIRAVAMALLVAAVFTGRAGEAAESFAPPRFGLRAMLIGVTAFCLIAGLLSALFGWIW